MKKIELTLACEAYDRTDALREGRIQPEGIDLVYLSLSPQETFWRMLRHLEFDAAEMSLAAWTVAKSRGEDRIIAIPVFTSREFRHSAIYVNLKANITKPEDLRGKRVGVPEYMLTAVVWARGILQSEYGIEPKEMKWLIGGQEDPGRQERIELKKPPGVSIERVPEDQTLSAMLMRASWMLSSRRCCPRYILRALPGCAACSRISARWKKLTIKRPACFRSCTRCA